MAGVEKLKTLAIAQNSYIEVDSIGEVERLIMLRLVWCGAHFCVVLLDVSALSNCGNPQLVVYVALGVVFVQFEYLRTYARSVGQPDQTVRI